MFSSGLSGLKSLGDKLAEGAREFENSLAQPLIGSPSSTSSPQRRSDSPSSSSSSPQKPESPSRSNSSRSTILPSNLSSTLSLGAAQLPSAAQVNVQLQSASQLADSALSSLRMSFKKGRASLEGARTRSLSSEVLPSGGSRDSSPVSSPLKEKPVSTTNVSGLATIVQEPSSTPVSTSTSLFASKEEETDELGRRLSVVNALENGNGGNSEIGKGKQKDELQPPPIVVLQKKEDVVTKAPPATYVKRVVKSPPVVAVATPKVEVVEEEKKKDVVPVVPPPAPAIEVKVAPPPVVVESKPEVEEEEEEADEWGLDATMDSPPTQSTPIIVTSPPRSPIFPSSSPPPPHHRPPTPPPASASTPVPTSPERERGEYHSPKPVHPSDPSNPFSLLRPSTPDDRFAISATADGTPEGPTPIPTPTPIVDTIASPPPTSPLTTSTTIPVPSTSTTEPLTDEVETPLVEISSPPPTSTLLETPEDEPSPSPAPIPLPLSHSQEEEVPPPPAEEEEEVVPGPELPPAVEPSHPLINIEPLVESTTVPPPLPPVIPAILEDEAPPAPVVEELVPPEVPEEVVEVKETRSEVVEEEKEAIPVVVEEKELIPEVVEKEKEVIPEVVEEKELIPQAVEEEQEKEGKLEGLEVEEEKETKPEVVEEVVKVDTKVEVEDEPLVESKDEPMFEAKEIAPEVEVVPEVKEEVSTSKEVAVEEVPVQKPPAPSPSSTVAATSSEADWLKKKALLEKIVLAHMPTLSGLDDPDALEAELQNLTAKNKISMSEVVRLTGQLDQHKERMEEIRDTHRLEAKSQSTQLQTLSSQLSEKEQQLTSHQSQVTSLNDTIKTLQSTISKSTEDYDKLKIVAKEEEEKRVKALSLLRALRQKLVKAEKDKEDLEKEKDSLKGSEVSAQEGLKADRARFDQEIVAMRGQQEGQLNKLRGQFEREIASTKAQYEREAMAKKGQFELDAITTKATHGKELQIRDARIQQLEGTVKELTTGRDELFAQLQVRTAEVEALKTEQETLKGKTGELQYEVNEAKDRYGALEEELQEVKRVQRDNDRDDGNVRRLLAEADARHSAKVKELETRHAQLEKDRLETEEEMGRNLQERLKEVERMREQIVKKDIDYATSVHEQRQRDEKIEKSETRRKELEARVKSLDATVAELRNEVAHSVQAEAAVREELSDRAQRGSELEQRLETVQLKESALRSNNKILRDELRKLQSGVLLSEKQRNPGVGYFANYTNPVASSSSLPMSPGSDGGDGTPRSRSESLVGERPNVTGGSSPLGSVAAANGDAAINFEYMRNVILQFLERPEMRPHLLSVLGVILHFTPAEARRLAAKAV